MAFQKIDIRAEFLAKGGTLLKVGENSAGEPVILQKNSDRDWNERLTFTRTEHRDKTLAYLLKKHKTFFRRG